MAMEGDVSVLILGALFIMDNYGGGGRYREASSCPTHYEQIATAGLRSWGKLTSNHSECKGFFGPNIADSLCQP